MGPDEIVVGVAVRDFGVEKIIRQASEMLLAA